MSPVPPLIVSEDGDGFGLLQNSVSGSEVAATDGDLFRRCGVEVLEPVG
jgi:hypothetical protein